MRRLAIFLTQIILLTAWSGLSVPAGRAYQGSPDGTPCYGAYLDHGSEDILDPTLDYVPDQILVKFKENIPEQQKQLAMTSAKASAKNRIEKLNVTLVKVAAGEMEKSLALLKNDPGVVYAEPNYIARAQDSDLRPRRAGSGKKFLRPVMFWACFST